MNKGLNQVLKKDLNQNILALALYSSTPQKNFSNLFLPVTGSMPWYSFVTYAELMSLKFLCLHKLFSSHSAIKSNTDNSSVRHENRYREQSPFPFSSVTPVYISEIHVSWRAHQLLPCLTFFLFLSAMESMYIEGRESAHFLLNLKKALK